MNKYNIMKETQWLLDEKHKGRLSVAAKRDIAQLKNGEHVDYVIGFVDFLGCKIDLSLRPLIPRPETEYWVSKAVESIQCKMQDTKYRIRILDIFAGSGCIGVAVLKHVSRAHVDFGEKEKKFCDQIKINATLNSIDLKRYRVIQSDVFSSIKGKYDYIFANPPYIAESRKSKVQKSVLEHEPKTSLFAGKDGLDIIRKFLSRAKEFLAPGGDIYLEFDSFQKRSIEQYLKKNGYQNWQFFKDQYGKWRWLVAT